MNNNKLQFTLIVILSIIIIGCSSPKRNTNDTIETSEISDLPSGVSYSLISEDKNEALSKVVINVRLNTEVDEGILKKIANEIKEKNSDYSKIWIFYFLPEMTTGNGAWAISHFTPNLDLQILGASKEASEQMKNRLVSGNILNIWIDNDPIMPNTKYLVEDEGLLKMKSIYAKTKYIDASEIVEILSKTKYKGLTRYNYENNHGEYYLIETNGNLGIYDSEGKFKEIKRK